MPSSDPGPDPGRPNQGGFFPATHWTILAAVQDPDNPAALEALNNLCTTYLPALERYLRWFRNLPGDPHELANEFLAQFIHQDSLRRVDRNKGKFRSYVIGALKNFLRNQWRARARGPKLVEIDTGEAEFDLPDSPEADAAFDRDIAQATVQKAVTRTGEHFAGSRIESMFPLLLRYIISEPPAESLRDLAARLGVSEDLVHQNRRRIAIEFRRRLRLEVSQLVGPQDDVEEELRALIRAYARPPT